ncbi:flagellar hook-length control protein FliK [Pseudomonas sp. BN417]|uniref:flagellar hook-length control protein FliK n=1 Tax=Pseudomonas sp. BN417 TaxID=2567890 RepID=UPI0024556389|nr:flagellar hook-length control protein FliK [Pseudomonas sp. BN417]MDH4553586.1 flagellar hook-length control protein FliK [Pseudomonas sp. BN417]
MPVAPDLLLQARPAVKPKAPAAKAPEKPVETSRDEAASFARMYAKERQAKTTEHNEAAARQSGTGSDEAASPDTSTADPAVSQPAVADSGKPLPAEEGEPGGASDEPAMDPLLVMAMTGQLPADEAPADPALTGTTAADSAVTELGGAGEALLAAPVTPQAGNAAQVALNEVSLDPELGQSSGAPAVKTAVDQGVQVARTTPAAAWQLQDATSAQAAPTLDQEFSAALAALVDKPLEADEGRLDDALSSTEFAVEASAGLGENKGEVRNELLANRLSALSQAIGLQAAQVQRAPALVPGQSVAMNQGGWSEAVVDRVMWLSSQNLKSAEIQLDPQELGRLEVRVHMTQDQTQVTFASPHANVRDALEGQMHRLRELFAQQGMNQLDVNVSDQSLSRGWQGQGGDGERRSAGGRGDFGAGGEEEISVSHSEIRPASAGGRGLVDFYA